VYVYYYYMPTKFTNNQIGNYYQPPIGGRIDKIPNIILCDVIIHSRFNIILSFYVSSLRIRFQVVILFFPI